jgi:peroxiredoxin
VQLRKALPRFGALGVRVVCVVQGTEEEARRFCGRHGLAGVCLGDPQKASYRAMGLGRTHWSEILLASKELRRRRAEARELGCAVSLKGTFQQHSDVLQLPGAALVDRGGAILWLHRGAHVADLPAADELLRIAAELLARRIPSGDGDER